MQKRTLSILLVLLQFLSANDPDHTNAEKLVAHKQKSDMSYKQMMQRMGEAYHMIQTGIINQNKALVTLGASLIQNHPAPKNKPWSIVKKEDVAAFKQTLLAYDKLLHEGTRKLQKSVKTKTPNWSLVNENAFALSNHCVSCHAMWKENLK